MIRPHLFSFLKIGKDFFSKYGKSLSLHKSFSLHKSLSLALIASLILSLFLFTACADDDDVDVDDGDGDGDGGVEEVNALTSLTLEIRDKEYAVNFDKERNAEVSVGVSKIAAPPETAVLSNLKLIEGAIAKDSSDNPITGGNSVFMSPSGDKRKVEINVTDKDDNTRIYTITITIIVRFEIKILTLSGHDDGVTSISYSPDGSKLVSSGEDGKIKIWDASVTANTDAPNVTLSGHSGSVIFVAYSPDGSKLASGGTDGKIKIWDATVADDSSTPLATLSDHSKKVNSVAFNSDGSRLASASSDGTIKTWDASKLKDENPTAPLITSLAGHLLGADLVAYTLDDSKLASTGESDKDIKIWDVTAGGSTSIPFAIIKGDTGSVKGHTGSVNSIAFHPDGLKLVSGSEDNSIKIWDISKLDDTPPTTPLIATLRGHSQWVNSVAFSRDGLRLASGSADKTVKLWDVSKLDETPPKTPLVVSLTEHTDSISSVAFSRDGLSLVSGSYDTAIKIWR